VALSCSRSHGRHAALEGRGGVRHRVGTAGRLWALSRLRRGVLGRSRTASRGRIGAGHGGGARVRTAGQVGRLQGFAGARVAGSRGHTSQRVAGSRAARTHGFARVSPRCCMARRGPGECSRGLRTPSPMQGRKIKGGASPSLPIPLPSVWGGRCAGCSGPRMPLLDGCRKPATARLSPAHPRWSAQ